MFLFSCDSNDSRQHSPSSWCINVLNAQLVKGVMEVLIGRKNICQLVFRLDKRKSNNFLLKVLLDEISIYFPMLCSLQKNVYVVAVIFVNTGIFNRHIIHQWRYRIPPEFLPPQSLIWRSIENRCSRRHIMHCIKWRF